MFHPFYKNTLIVLQEAGAVHAIDVLTGQVVHEFLAHCRVNSSIAADGNMCLAMGENGHALFFEISMGSRDI